MPTALENAVARRDAILAQLQTLPAAGTVSDQGRSVSYDRAGLLQELDYLQKLIVTLDGPFVTPSRARA